MIDARFAGGPYDGDTFTVDDDTASVLIADAEDGQAWLYDRQASTAVFALNTTSPADPATGTRPFDEDAAIAAVGAGVCVIADPGDNPTQDEIDAEEVITDGE